MERLFLLGTIHRLAQGKERLLELLEDLLPRAVSLEMSRFSYRFRRAREGLWLRRLEELSPLLTPKARKGLRSILELPYELKAAQEFALKFQVPLYLVDLSLPAREYLLEIDRLLKKGAIELLEELGQSLEAEARELAILASRALKAPERFFFHFTWRWGPLEALRGEIMARRLRRRLRWKAPLVHIGGFEHLLPYPGRLIKHLEDLSPRVIFIWQEMAQGPRREDKDGQIYLREIKPEDRTNRHHRGHKSGA
ncbi:hypothetical protein [Thermosulfuriphilus sp.]